MCRRPIYFKGFHKVEHKWNEEAWEVRCSEAFEKSVDDTIQNLCENLVQWSSEFHPFFIRHAMNNLRENERMFSTMKEECFDSEEIDYLLNETDIYFAKNHEIYMPAVPRHEKVSYKRNVHKAMRFKKNNVR